MKKSNALLLVLLLFSLASVGYCKKTPTFAAEKSINIISQNSHYEVVLDYEKQPSHREMGETYAAQILQMVPNYEYLIDSYLQEWTDAFKEVLNIGTEDIIKRISDIKAQIKEEYRAEIEGLAAGFSGPEQAVSGDGKLSVDEIYMYNLITDVLRVTQCSAFGVYGSRSVTGKTIAARIMDWYCGAKNQLAQLQAVTTFKNANKTICTVGYLGFMGVVTGLNNNLIFAAILDSNTGQEYNSQGNNSYVFDIRDALEQYTTLDEVGNCLKAPERTYTYSHLVFLADSHTCKVLENNISSAISCIRDLRTAESALNPGIEWGITNAIGCVNSFLLKGNFDNHSSETYNTARWESLKRTLLAQGDIVNVAQVKTVASYHEVNTLDQNIDGNLYRSSTQQIVIFDPDKPELQVFFRPRSGLLPETPFFDKCPLHF
jgi:hypothetical protein